MPDFIETAKGMPGLKDLSATTVEGLAEMALAEIAGAHRWPFLLRVQQSFTWAASDSVQSFPGVARIWNIMFPDSNSDYYKLQELSDSEFQDWIELYPDDTYTRIWRDAGMDGDRYQFELYAAPTAAKTLKIDYTVLPALTDIDTFPKRFHLLVLSRMQMAAGSLHPLAYQQLLQDTIGREHDLQGRRSHMGMDPVQAERMRNAANPS